MSDPTVQTRSDPAGAPVGIHDSGDSKSLAPVAAAAADSAASEAPLLRVEDVEVHFPVGRNIIAQIRGKEGAVVHAVDGVSLTLDRKRTLGLVGESGCGKTTLGKSIMRLHKPTSGRIVFEGHDVSQLSQRQMLPLRRKLQMVFQDPYSSLNRRKTVGRILERPLTVHDVGSRSERRDMIEQAMESVGIEPSYANRFPHEFSGGQRQRIGIARALILDPDLIVLDEPVSALDVSVQAQILNLLMDLQDSQGFAYLFIAHDLSVVKRICDEVAVMYLGQIVEFGSAREVLSDPQHPYTQALLSAVPGQRDKGDRIVLKGSVPSPLSPPSGCRFHTRCPMAAEVCGRVVPKAVEVQPGWQVACHLYDEEMADEMKAGTP